MPACYGYALRSQLEFEVVRDGGAESPLVVGEGGESFAIDSPPLLEWHDEGRPFARLWSDDGRHRVWVDSIGWFGVDPTIPRIDAPTTSSGIRRETRLWGVPAALCFMERGDLPLHAAAVDVGGHAVILAAPGRHGKTTLAAAFTSCGHRLLSEDLTCVRTSPSLSVLPGPALLRVRRDVFDRLTFPGTTVLAEDADRVYVAVTPDRRGDGAPVPVAAIVFLRTTDESSVRVERVSPHDAIPDLWTLSFNLPTDRDRSRCFAGVAALGSGVPVYNVHRRLAFDTLDDVIDEIVRLAT